jgi:SAM-dependent methyltransferase
MAIKHLPYEITPETNRQHYYENHWKVVGLNLLARHLPPPGRSLLDYGCGRGETMRLAREMGFTASGTDVDPECLRLSGEQGPVKPLDLADPVRQFGEKSFDAVSCFHVLEHVDTPKRTLGDLARLARQYVVVAVPNLRQLMGVFSRRVDLEWVNEGHLQGWDHLHLRSLAERHCGLDLVAWGFDTTQLAVLSEISQRLLGTQVTIRLETGLFRRLFPFHGLSVLGLFRVR